MTAPRIGSLCTGYGGLDMAVTDAFGGELAWVADNDPGAAAILTHHHPAVPNHGDITTTDWDKVEPVDMLTAGFPCQPVSNAGLRLGDQDDRWIWPAVAHAVRVLRPGLVFLENVAALTVRGLDRVVADLAAIGYVGSWRCIRASDVGACHRRERVFIAAWPADTTGAGLEAGRKRRDRGSAAADSAHLGHERGGEARGRRPGPAHSGVAPADADGSGRRTAVDYLQPWQSDADRGLAADSEGDGRDEGRTEPARLLRGPDAALGRDVDWGRYAPAVARWEHVTRRSAPAPTEPTGRDGASRLSPAFVEWLMGLPAGHVTDVPGLTRNQQLKALGNGVVPQQAAAALHLLLARTPTTAEGAAA